MSMEEAVQKMIQEDVSKHPIVLYVKGDKGLPQCGFSAAVMSIFDHLGTGYEVRNVLADPNVRDGVKKFTSWPTIPQVFIGGKFVGGCDIVKEMFENGELETLVRNVSSPTK